MFFNGISIYKWMRTGGSPMTQKTSISNITGMILPNAPGGERQQVAAQSAGSAQQFW